MATATLVSLSEYLTTSYSPDCDWIDGEIRERNVGELPHSLVQQFFIVYFSAREDELDIWVLPEVRVQTSELHYRIADICVVRRGPGDPRIVREKPLLCIEVLSWDDRASEIDEKVADYLGMGASAVWLVDPRRRRARLADPSGIFEVDTLTVPGTGIQVAVADIFRRLDLVESRR